MRERLSGVLFDVGGVLADLDRVPSLAALLGVAADYDFLHSRWMASPAVIAHETGKISTAEFCVGVVSDLHLPIAPESFLENFQGWLRGPLPGASELLNEIAPTYRLAALSNMSAAHWAPIVAAGLTRRFDHVFVSHETGWLKPAREAFEIALRGMQLRPGEVLFLDDGLANLEAARDLGLNAHLVRGPAEARNVLVTYGVITRERPRVASVAAVSAVPSVARRPA